jgi:hypothetical protein
MIADQPRKERKKNKTYKKYLNNTVNEFCNNKIKMNHAVINAN